MSLTLGQINISDRLFLGKEELTRQQSFLINKLKLLLTLNGVGFLGSDSFSLSIGSIGSGTFNIQDSLAIDINGDIIYKEAQNSIKVPEGSFWLGVRSKSTPLEKGTCSITVENGVYKVIGVGTEFTKIFRNSSNIYKPTRIEFEKTLISESTSLQNTGTYTILEVIDDTQLLIIEPLYADTNLKVKCVGTFAHDRIPSNEEKYPYLNCGSELILIPELISGQKPSFSSYGVEGETVFIIASIFNTSGTLTITDKRETFYSKFSDFLTDGSWSLLSPSLNFFSVNDRPLKIRSNHFKKQFEIQGKFISTVTSGTICVLPEEFWPEESRILKCIKEDTNEEILLNLSVEGELSNLTSFTFTTSANNYIYNQIVTL